MNSFNFIPLRHSFYLASLIVASLTFSVNAEDKPKNEGVYYTPVADTSQRMKGFPHQIQLKARHDHDFKLSADYRFFPEKASDKHMSGVIVLHDCDSQRNQYKSLSENLVEQGLHTLSLDLRGYGKSVQSEYSETAVKREAKSISDYNTGIAALMFYWPEDLLAAHNFLRTKVHKSKGISVIASGCSSAYAVGLAESVYIKSLVLLTPKMSYADKERYKNLIDIPTYFISSAQHAMSHAVSDELFSWNGHKQTKIQIYKGNKLNNQILKANKPLGNDIALWLKGF